MIQMARDGNGVMRPVLTTEQTEKAREVIMDEIDIQLGQKITQDEPAKPTKPPEGDKPTDAQINAQTKGAEIKQIMSGGFSELEIEQKLKVASGNQFTFKYKKATNTYDAIKIGAKKPSFTGLKTASDMYKIFSTGAQEQYYKQGTKSKSKTQQKPIFD